MSGPGGTSTPRFSRRLSTGLSNPPTNLTHFENIDYQYPRKFHYAKLAESSTETPFLSQVYASPGTSAIDIVFVHGLNGHPYKTWTSMSGCFWPVDLLPKTLSPILHRILIYSYDTSGGNDISSLARKLAEALATDRKVSDPSSISSSA
jgi:hypothetical protein